MATLTIEIPDDAFATLHRSPKELTQELRLAAAMVWYTQGRISHETAALFSGVRRIAFIAALAAAKLPAFHVDVDEPMEEVECARQSICEHIAPGVDAGRAGRPPDRTPVRSARRADRPLSDLLVTTTLVATTHASGSDIGARFAG